MLSVKSRRRTVAVLAAVFVVAGGGTAGVARADDGDLFLEGCLARTAVTGCPAGLPGAPMGIAQSPDGQQLYVTMNASGGGSYHGLKIFDRDPQTGVATPRGGPASCFAAVGAGVPCTLVAGALNFSNAYEVAVGPDGRNVYLVTFGGSLVNLARDTTTGALTYVNCLGNGPACTDLVANAGAMSVAVRPDSQNVYVKTSIGLAVLDRNGGTLQVAQKPGFDGCFSEGSVPGCDEVDGLNGDSSGCRSRRTGGTCTSRSATPAASGSSAGRPTARSASPTARPEGA